MTTIKVVIPGNPGLASANRSRRHAVHKGRAMSYQSADSKTWRAIADEAFRAAISEAQDANVYFRPYDPIDVHVKSWWPRWSKQYQQPLGDVDNVAKQMNDAIVRSGLVNDDVLVAKMVMEKGHDKHNPRIEVTVMQGDVCDE